MCLRVTRIAVVVACLLLMGCGSSSRTVRFATFNTALSKDAPGELLATLRTPDDAQARAVAEIVQRVRPDVLLLQEFDHGGDYDPDGRALALFQANYLAVSQNGGEPIRYEHVYLAPSNTGLPTGVDLNGDGLIAPSPGAEIGSDAYAADCHGWGTFPGQYAFVVLSKYPINREGVRTFQEFLWKDLPGNHMPADYYSEAARDVLRLSSKNHVDVPIRVGGQTIHVLASHPTPPVFDGPEDRNGRRNHDEITFWPYYIDKFAWPHPFDDQGRQGHLPSGPRRGLLEWGVRIAGHYRAPVRPSWATSTPTAATATATIRGQSSTRWTARPASSHRESHPKWPPECPFRLRR